MKETMITRCAYFKSENFSDINKLKPEERKIIDELLYKAVNENNVFHLKEAKKMVGAKK